MHKAIYLNIVITASQSATTSEQIHEIQTRLTHGLQKTPRQLSGVIKRLRVKAGKIEALVYLEGEQDAPQNFSELAISDVKKSLETAFVVPLTNRSHLQISDIQENTNAVDELADEETHQS